MSMPTRDQDWLRVERRGKIPGTAALVFDPRRRRRNFGARTGRPGAHPGRPGHRPPGHLRPPARPAAARRAPAPVGCRWCGPRRRRRRGPEPDAGQPGHAAPAAASPAARPSAPRWPGRLSAARSRSVLVQGPADPVAPPVAGCPRWCGSAPAARPRSAASARRWRADRRQDARPPAGVGWTGTAMAARSPAVALGPAVPAGWPAGSLSGSGATRAASAGGFTAPARSPANEPRRSAPATAALRRDGGDRRRRGRNAGRRRNRRAGRNRLRHDQRRRRRGDGRNRNLLCRRRGAGGPGRPAAKRPGRFGVAGCGVKAGAAGSGAAADAAGEAVGIGGRRRRVRRRRNDGCIVGVALVSIGVTAALAAGCHGRQRRIPPGSALAGSPSAWRSAADRNVRTGWQDRSGRRRCGFSRSGLPHSGRFRADTVRRWRWLSCLRHKSRHQALDRWQHWR